VEIYSSEEQQEEAIKRFLKNNGLSLVVGAIVGLGGIYGWNYYQQSQLETMAQHSQAFSTVSQKLASSTTVVTDGDAYIADHSDSQYSQLTQLIMVKSLVDNKDYDQATAILNQVISSDVEAAIKSIAMIRLARIEAMLNKNEQALTTLASLTDSAFSAQKNELQGNIYLAQGDIAKARTAYQAAIDISPELPNVELKMKLNDLTPAA